MTEPTPKYIFVTGGVLSGLGKGITAASIGNILKRHGYAVSMQKFDQYINVDAGTLNPAEHGEVFVTDDGAECDLDLGHYERFLDQNVRGDSSVMTGEIYEAVIHRERRGDYLGETVQVIPHVTNEVKKRAVAAAAKSESDIHIVEIGGTVGDNEGFHFIEAARQMGLEAGPQNVLYVHVVFLPYLKASDEVKTKPAQNSVRELRSIGIQPDILIARTDHAVEPGMIRKLSLYTNVDEAAILPLVTAPSVYEVPIIMEDNKLDEIILQRLGLKPAPQKNGQWRSFVQHIKADKDKITIALVGKYTSMLDTYASLVEALKSSAWANDRDLVLRWINAEELEKTVEMSLPEFLGDAAAVVVPGGFGNRGTEGKINAIRYARENNIPYFGICLGMQLASIEFARHVAGISQATSQEFSEEIQKSALAQRSPEPAEGRSWVIHLMEDQKVIKQKGGTMRLGGWDCRLAEGTKSYEAYRPAFAKSSPGLVRERHRHRYEFNNEFRQALHKAGLAIAGTTVDGSLVEIIELPAHPWFVGVQFHPEFTSRPTTGHPLFNSFLAAAIARSQT